MFSFHFYEIKTNFPQNYHVLVVFRQSFIDDNNLVKVATTHWKLPLDTKVYYTDTLPYFVSIILGIIYRVCC